MKKNYVVDTNCLLEDENCIEVLRNGVENKVFICSESIEELDRLKKTNKSHLVRPIVKKLLELHDQVTILEADIIDEGDNQILQEILSNMDKFDSPPIFVTNDKLFSFKALKAGIAVQDYKRSVPFKSESEKYTGFISEDEDLVHNCFYFDDGKMYFCHNEEEHLVSDNQIWGLKPKTPYQNATMELLLNDRIKITSIVSSAGFGKSTLAMAAALQLTQGKKSKYNKIYVMKHHVEVGGVELGFLPGSADDKTLPYFRPILNVLEKLHKIRECNRLFIDPKANELQINKRKIEFIPLNFCRGIEFSDCILVIDELQNFTKQDLKTILSRCGDNVRVITTADNEQVDNPHCTIENNACNWLMKAFKDHPKFGHVVLQGENSRGEIADMVRESIL